MTNTTNELTAATEQLTRSDWRGLVTLTHHRHGPLHRWLFLTAMGHLTDDTTPDFAPWGWQTTEIRDSLARLGILSQLLGSSSPACRQLFRAMTDICLDDLADRRAM